MEFKSSQWKDVMQNNKQKEGETFYAKTVRTCINLNRFIDAPNNAVIHRLLFENYTQNLQF